MLHFIAFGLNGSLSLHRGGPGVYPAMPQEVLAGQSMPGSGWGKSTPDREVVCLIEGKIEITQPNDTPFTMDQRLSYYVHEGGLSRPVATVMADQLREWAAETETQQGRGVSTRGGKWKITVAAGLTPQRAFDLYRDLRKGGYPAEIVPSKAGDRRVYNVLLSNFETKQDAEFVAGSLKRQAGFGAHGYSVGM